MRKINSRHAELVRLIATGATLSSAADALTISTSRARQLLNVACRVLGLPDGVQDIQADPQQYLGRVQELAASYSPGLRQTLLADLMRRLSLPGGTVITPQLLARYSAAQLTAAGFTTGAVADVQAWLAENGQQFKRGPLSPGNVKALSQAINLLAAFHFDVTAAREQLQAELAGEG